MEKVTGALFIPIDINGEHEDKVEDMKLILESDEHIQFPDESKYDSYDHLCKYILRLVKVQETLCKGLTTQYIEDAFKSAHAIVVLSSLGVRPLPNGNIFGFALIEFDESDNSLYIDVICSHKGIKYAGENLLKSLEYICGVLFIKKIKLNSVSSAISFYEKYGFVKKGIM